MSTIVRLLENRSVRKRRHDLPALKGLVAPGPDVRLLDIGGGAGIATVRFASGCRRIVILEPDPRKLRYGRRANPPLSFVRGKAEALPFPDDSFERVAAVVSFHHVGDPDRALREIRRVLSPGGRLVLHELYPEAHAGWFARVLGKRLHGSPPSFYEPDALRQILDAHGFRDLSVTDGERGYFVTGSR